MKFLSLLLCVGLLMGMASSSGDKLVGLWELSDKSGKTMFFKLKGKYCGKLVWGKNVVKSDKVTSKKDLKNPNEKLRNRDVLGIIYIWGLKYEDGQYTDGYVYDPTSGKTYNCKMWFEGKDLKFRGYMGVSALGKTVTYKRLK